MSRLAQAVVVAVALLLAGCAQQVPVDVGRAELMPESVARRVVERRMPPGWLDRPYLDRFSCFQTGVRYVRLGDIRGAVYVDAEPAFYVTNYADPSLNCENAALRVTGISIDEARELTIALVSLGAAIKR